jgi:hypothetical protein
MESIDSWRKLLEDEWDTLAHLEDECRSATGAFAIVEHDELNPFCDCPACLAGYVEHGILRCPEKENEMEHEFYVHATDGHGCFAGMKLLVAADADTAVAMGKATFQQVPACCTIWTANDDPKVIREIKRQDVRLRRGRW